MKPTVSVVMSVYNGEAFLEDAMNSIINQTFTDLEFIIINDGSSDNSINIIKEYQDKRIVLIDNNQNMGLIYSLNLGLSKAKGKYIVRMDADDISLPNRIEKQVSYMEENTDIGICGSYIERFGANIKNKIIKKPINHKLNAVQLLFEPTLAHPSVIIRKSIIDKFNLQYREQYKHAEDYAFWVESLSYTKISNIPDILLKYRILPTSITRQADKDFEKRFSVHKLIYLLYFKHFNYTPSDDELLLHFIISNNDRFINFGKNMSPNVIKSYFKKIGLLITKSKQIDSDFLLYSLNKRGASISRWYSKNRLYFIYYLANMLYYKVKIMFK